MNNQEYLIEEYKSLREEIKETKSRIFKTMAFGLSIVPATNFLAMTYELDIILFTTPILVIVLALLYLSENHGLMRCGRYIYYEIEKKIGEEVGWEHWLERKSHYDPRSVDKLLSISFYLLFFVYFSASVYLAYLRAALLFSLIASALIITFYAAIGIWFLIYLLRTIRVSTRTKFDQTKLQ